MDTERFAKYGRWAFTIGLVISVLAGIFYQPEWAIWVLAILGVIVGLLNITAKDTRGFLLASIAFTISATALNTVPVIGKAFELILPFVVAFVAGAMIVVAFKELFQAARSHDLTPEVAAYKELFQTARNNDLDSDE